MIPLICGAIERGGTKYLCLRSDQLKRNKAFVRSISFDAEIDVDENYDPTARQSA